MGQSNRLVPLTWDNCKQKTAILCQVYIYPTSVHFTFFKAGELIIIKKKKQTQTKAGTVNLSVST